MQRTANLGGSHAPSAEQAEVFFVSKRVQAQYQAEVGAQPAHLLQIAPCVVGHPDTPALATLPARFQKSPPQIAASVTC